MKKSDATSRTESAHTKRQRRRAERIILATGVHSPSFRKAVENALEQFTKGDGTTLRQLFREADEIDRQREEIGKAIRARMQQSLTKPKRKRRISGRQETANGLAALEVTDQNRAAINEITQALLLWAGFLLELNPAFTSRLYTLIADEWTKHVRGTVYHVDDSNDPRERASRTLNVVVLGALSKLQGRQDIPMTEHEVGERIDGLRPCGRVLLELANSADEGFTEPARPLNLYAHTREGAEEEDTDKTARLRSQLAKLERLPENEAIRFQIESELYKLENGESGVDEWPEVIGDNR